MGIQASLFDKVLTYKGTWLKVVYQSMSAERKQQLREYIEKQIAPMIEHFSNEQKGRFLKFYFFTLWRIKNEDLSVSKVKKAAGKISDINSTCSHLMRHFKKEIEHIIDEGAYNALLLLSSRKNLQEVETVLNTDFAGKSSFTNIKELEKYHAFFSQQIAEKNLSYRVKCLDSKFNFFTKESKTGHQVNAEKILVNGCALVGFPMSENAMRKQLNRGARR